MLLLPKLDGLQKPRTRSRSLFRVFLLAAHWVVSQAWSPGLQNGQRMQLHEAQNNVPLLKPLCALQFPEDDEEKKERNHNQHGPTPEQIETKNNPTFPAMLTESWVEDGGDRKATRVASSHSKEIRKTTSVGHDWGIHQQTKSLDERSTSPIPQFPDTIELVANQANDAIVFSLTEENLESSSGLVDPHVLNNIWAGDRFWQDRRPVRKAADRGRIGIEIDGILPSLLSPTRRMTRSSTIRSVSLLMAGQLATHPAWCNDMNQEGDSIPIMLYFNTIKQALWASHELSQLRQMHVSSEENPYDSVSILALGEEESLPAARLAASKGNRARNTKSRPYKDGSVDPSRGIIIVVEPTDFNQEYKPPGPSIGAAERLQKLAAQAALFAYPMVVISPRFAQSATGWDQSGYTQSATFGGLEPPRGPTPWILRDFVPPVYSWAGKVVALAATQRESASKSHHLLGYDDERDDERSVLDSHHGYSSISMVQSVLHRQRAWHIYGLRSHSREAPSGMTPVQKCEYLASTKSSAGRPTAAVCTWIWKEFAAF